MKQNARLVLLLIIAALMLGQFVSVRAASPVASAQATTYFMRLIPGSYPYVVLRIPKGTPMAYWPGAVSLYRDKAGTDLLGSQPLPSSSWYICQTTYRCAKVPVGGQVKSFRIHLNGSYSLSMYTKASGVTGWAANSWGYYMP